MLWTNSAVMLQRHSYTKQSNTSTIQQTRNFFFFSRAQEGSAAVHQLTWLTDSTRGVLFEGSKGLAAHEAMFER